MSFDPFVYYIVWFIHMLCGGSFLYICTFMCSGWVSLLCVIGDSVMAGKSVVGVMFV